MHLSPSHNSRPLDTLLFPGTEPSQLHAEDSFQERLRKTLILAIQRKKWPGLVIHLRLNLSGITPQEFTSDLLDAARTLIENVLDHGLYQRSFGSIQVSLHGTASGALLEVKDNGWGVGSSIVPGAGFDLLRSLGAFSLANVIKEGRTAGAVASLLLPSKRRGGRR